MINFLKNNKLFIICISIFIFITFPKMISHYPCADEAQNFMVSYFINFSNWVDLLSFHGHPSIWYLIMMPFSRLNIGYPYSILFLNYLFILSALIIMWRKAEFDNIYKVIITFSYMILNYYTVTARCYSIGILGLFIIASLYPNQNKRPILYAVLLGLTANTSAIAAIAVIPLSMIFIYNLCLNRDNIKKIISAVFILVFFAVIFLLPFIETSTYKYSSDEMYFFISSLKNFFMPAKLGFLFVFSYLFVIFYLLFRSKDIKSKFFLIFSTSLFWIFMFFVYKCLPYHRFFFFIFIILTMWIQNYYEKYKKNSIIFILALIIIMYTPYDLKSWTGQKYIYEFGQTLKTDALKYNNSIVVIPDYYIRYETAPFLVLNNPDVEIFGCKNFYDYRFTDGENCDYKQNVSDLVLNSEKPIYMFSNEYIKNYKLVDTIKGINIYKLR